MREAVEVGWPGPGRERRAPAGDALVWIRVGGAWRSGYVRQWIRGDSGWLAWICHDSPDGWLYPAWGLYEYDEAAIRRRTEGEPPPAVR